MPIRNHNAPWGLFFLNPFLLMLVSIRYNKARWAPNALWAFVVFFGLTFAIGEENQGSDIHRYLDLLEYFYLHINYVDEAYTYFINSGQLDVIQYVIAYLVSRLTDSQPVLTVVYAFIFGYFYSRNIFYLFRQLKGHLPPWTWLLVTIFMLIVPFWNINGFRFWTATHVYVFGLLPYLLEGRKRSLWLCGLSVFIHFTYLLPVLVLLGYHILPKRIFIALSAFLFTFIYREVDPQWLNTILAQYAPAIFIDRTDSYLSAEQIEQYRSTTRTVQWYAIWYGRVLNYAISFLLVLIAIKFRTRIQTIVHLRRLLFFTFIFYSIANLASSVPSGGRFISTAMLLGIFFITLFYQNYYRGSLSKYWLPILTPAFALFIIVSIRIGFYFISVSTLLSNPIVAIFTAGETSSMNDLIKNF